MTLNVELVSVPDRETLVAEIWCEGKMFAEVRREGGDLTVVEFYPNPDQKSWTFALEEITKALSKSQQRLLGVGKNELDPKPGS